MSDRVFQKQHNLFWQVTVNQPQESHTHPVLDGFTLNKEPKKKKISLELFLIVAHFISNI